MPQMPRSATGLSELGRYPESDHGHRGRDCAVARNLLRLALGHNATTAAPALCLIECAVGHLDGPIKVSRVANDLSDAHAEAQSVVRRQSGDRRSLNRRQQT